MYDARLHGWVKHRRSARIGAETREAIRGAYRRSGTVLDPHAAVAYSAAMRFQRAAGTRAPVVVLATAHPAKFADVIREELGVEPNCRVRARLAVASAARGGSAAGEPCGVQGPADGLGSRHS